MKKVKNSLLKCKNSFGYAFKGIRYLIANENNMRYHMMAAILTIVLGIYLQLDYIEWAIIALCIGLVFMAEAMNTALELTLNKVHPEYSKEIGLAKDVSAGAVLIISITAIAVAIFIFGSKIVGIIN